MPRTALTVQTPAAVQPVFSTPLTADSTTITFATADVSNGNSFPHTGKEVIIVKNINSGAKTFTITSVADGKSRRTGDITTYSLAAGNTTPTYAVVGPLPVDGWRQTDGSLYLAGSHADILFAVIRLP